MSILSLDYESLLSEIESGSSGSIANVIRKLREYEVTAYNAGVGGPTGEVVAKFIAELDQLIIERNIEIERTCNHHYEGLADSTRELVSIQEEAGVLKAQMLENYKAIQDQVNELGEASTELSNCHVMLSNIDQCIEALELCLPIIDQYSRVERSIEDGRYYHALKILEHLEKTQLEQIRQFTFSEALSRRIPKLRQEIKAKSLMELTDFLERIRKHSVRLGAIAMRQTAHLAGIDETTLWNSSADLTDGSSTNVTGLDLTSNNQATESKANGLPQSEKDNFGSESNHLSGIGCHTQDGLQNELESLTRLGKRLQQLEAGRFDEFRGSDHLGPPFSSSQDSSSSRVSPVTSGSSSAASRLLMASATLEELVDFGPVYRCLHVHSVLNEQADFERHYCSQRRKQCQLSLSLSPAQLAGLANYSEFFGGLVGFFLVDEHLRHTLPGKLGAYQAYLDELWANTVQRMLRFAQVNSAACSRPSGLVRLKEFVVLFVRTMQSLGFPTAGLEEMIELVQKRYETVLASQWRDRFETILSQDNYTSITLEDESLMKKLGHLYPPCQMADYLQPPIIFPRNIPYSWMVPLVYSAVRDYIDHCYRFSDHIFLACTDLEDSVTRATNALFSDSLSVALLHAIRKAESNLLRLIQLSVNVDELESACFHLEAYIQGLVNTKEDVMTRAKEDGGNIDEVVKGAPTTSGGLQRTRLHGHALFKDIRAQAESQIYANINARVDEFLGLASYEGILLTTSTGGMTDSAGDQTATILETATLGGPAAAGSRARAGNPLKPVVPSEYIVDMMAWLATTFRAFTNLPVKVAQTACLTACKHIASSLQNQILGPNVKAVSESALRQISSDLAECESFARSKPVPDVDTSMLILIFADLRMLIDLVLLDDWAVFLTGYSNSREPYDRVSPSLAIKLLERLRENDRRRQTFVQALKKDERERRKHMEDVIRQLKELNTKSFSR